MTIVEQLNKKVIEIFGTKINGQTPVDYQIVKDNGITIVPQECDSFQLNPAAHQSMTKFSSEINFDISSLKPKVGQNKQLIAIYRSRLGYALASRCSHDTGLLAYTFSMIMNDALRNLTSSLGDLKQFNISFNRPGNEQEIFQDKPDSMTLEVRFVVLAEVLYEVNHNEVIKDDYTRKN